MIRICLLFILMYALGFSQKPLRMAYINSGEPYSWVENGKVKGIFIDIMQEAIQKRMGLPLEQDGYSWIRAQRLVKEGVADGLITTSTKERLKYLHQSSQLVVTLPTTLYTYKDSKKIEELKKVKTLNDLKKFTLVEYKGNGWAKRHFTNHEVHWVGSRLQTFHVLAKKRADVLISNSISTQRTLNQLKLNDKIVNVPVILKSFDYYLLIQKNSAYAHLMPQFDATIKQMKEDGSIERIITKYLK